MQFFNLWKKFNFQKSAWKYLFFTTNSADSKACNFLKQFLGATCFTWKVHVDSMVHSAIWRQLLDTHKMIFYHSLADEVGATCSGISYNAALQHLPHHRVHCMTLWSWPLNLAEARWIAPSDKIFVWHALCAFFLANILENCYFHLQ